MTKCPILDLYPVRSIVSDSRRERARHPVSGAYFGFLFKEFAAWKTGKCLNRLTTAGIVHKMARTLVNRAEYMLPETLHTAGMLQPGRPAPAFDLPDADMSMVSLERFRNKRP